MARLRLRWDEVSEDAGLAPSGFVAAMARCVGTLVLVERRDWEGSGSGGGGIEPAAVGYFRLDGAIAGWMRQDTVGEPRVEGGEVDIMLENIVARPRHMAGTRNKRSGRRKRYGVQ